MAGDRQLVRQAIASYFGGSLVTADAGICYQGGPLTSYGLGTAYPYKIKGGAPDQYYFHGGTPGQGVGFVMTVKFGEVHITRARDRGGSLGGPTSGFMGRWYPVTCSFEGISYEPHLEQAELALDTLVDQFLDMIFADRTLGSTSAVLYPNPPYYGNRLIWQAGQFPNYIRTSPSDDWEVLDERGKARGGITVTFDAVTMVNA